MMPITCKEFSFIPKQKKTTKLNCSQIDHDNNFYYMCIQIWCHDDVREQYSHISCSSIWNNWYDIALTTPALQQSAKYLNMKLKLNFQIRKSKQINRFKVFEMNKKGTHKIQKKIILNCAIVVIGLKDRKQHIYIYKASELWFSIFHIVQNFYFSSHDSNKSSFSLGHHCFPSYLYIFSSYSVACIFDWLREI